MVDTLVPKLIVPSQTKYFHQDIVDVIIEVQEKDWDVVICISGGERRGKSMLALQIYEDFLRKKGMPIKLDFFATELDDYIKAIYESKKGGIVVLDEAGDTMTTANYFDELVKKIREAYTIIGAKNLVSILILPDYFLLDSYFRKWRVKSLFYVYERGKYAFYTGERLSRVNLEGRESKNPLLVARPNTKEKFPNYHGTLLQDYLKKKQKKVDAKIAELMDEFGLGETIFLKKASRYMKISYPTALKMVIDGTLPAIKTNANRYKVKVTDIIELMKGTNANSKTR